jgi:hypothetical protein
LEELKAGVAKSSLVREISAQTDLSGDIGAQSNLRDQFDDEPTDIFNETETKRMMTPDEAEMRRSFLDAVDEQMDTSNEDEETRNTSENLKKSDEIQPETSVRDPVVPLAYRNIAQEIDEAMVVEQMDTYNQAEKYNQAQTDLSGNEISAQTDLSGNEISAQTDLSGNNHKELDLMIDDDDFEQSEASSQDSNANILLVTPITVCHSNKYIPIIYITFI